MGGRKEGVGFLVPPGEREVKHRKFSVPTASSSPARCLVLEKRLRCDTSCEAQSGGGWLHFATGSLPSPCLKPPSKRGLHVPRPLCTLLMSDDDDEDDDMVSYVVEEYNFVEARWLDVCGLGFWFWPWLFMSTASFRPFFCAHSSCTTPSVDAVAAG